MLLDQSVVILDIEADDPIERRQHHAIRGRRQNRQRRDERLKQVFWNFLSNSVKFTPDGGTIRVRVLHDDHDAIIEVTDDGEGMSHDLLQHLFDRFTQGTDSVRKGGLGLGLSIVRHIIELHGGSVSAYSAGANRGATFTARLPLLRDAEPRRHGRPLPEATPMETTGEQVAMQPARRAGDRANTAS